MAVYVGARDLAGSLAFIGTHQFIVLIPDKGNLPPAVLPDGSAVYPKKLGNGKLGFVIGAQNRGRLIVEFFEKSDYKATLEHFNPNKHRKWYKSDFDAELKLVTHNSSDLAFIRRIITLTSNYIINES